MNGINKEEHTSCNKSHCKNTYSNHLHLRVHPSKMFLIPCAGFRGDLLRQKKNTISRYQNNNRIKRSDANEHGAPGWRSSNWGHLEAMRFSYIWEFRDVRWIMETVSRDHSAFCVLNGGINMCEDNCVRCTMESMGKSTRAVTNHEHNCKSSTQMWTHLNLGAHL